MGSHRILIEEDRLGFLKGYAVLPLVFTALLLIPCEPDIIHEYIVRMM